jgi:hypothetical protein
MRRSELLVVVVNYRTAALVEEGLECLAAELAGHAGSSARPGQSEQPARRVVVVDNDSGDGSFERLVDFVARRGFGAWASVVAAPGNGGFAAGNNVALRPALASATPPEYVLLLNPDALVQRGAVDALVDFANAHPRAGIVGSLLCHRDGRVQASTFRFPSVLSELIEGARFGPLTRLLARHHVLAPLTAEPSRTDWVAGASMLVRRAVFERIGLMDEGYFLYYEETDFCRRAAQAGFECWYVPASRVVHLVGQSTGVTNASDANRRRPSYWFESRRRYFAKFHGRLRTALADALFASAFALWRLRRRVQRTPDEDPARFLGDFVRHALRPLPNIAAHEAAGPSDVAERRAA